ncbi:MAG: BrnT family toxin [Marinobacter sp.]|uniref:BrnT family toxin n=1 Tax=Marinobacter sp. TaxID=50741 RepID=UPI001B5EB5E5|nr:BrnT family toxin [Marinobacter sp.]MBQ0745643.1 BrnT family toxin [Marinobacter sp.]MBQ0815577.1 BrnT family toxin [Marinobacter sp.]|tara:strand:- start:301 stop:573 length:273 start_codon:yes stop_codon:yes gene_type:complete
MYFEWDDSKNAANISKHGIDFRDAIDIFNHPMLTAIDERFMYEEERWISIGLMREIVGIVVYTERRESVTRIISARKATRREVKLYEQNI